MDTIYKFHRRSQEGTPETFPPKWKKLFGKMMLFPKTIFSNNFNKIVKNSIFLMNFYQKFSNISQNFSTICFSSKRAKN